MKVRLEIEAGEREGSELSVREEGRTRNGLGRGRKGRLILWGCPVEQSRKRGGEEGIGRGWQGRWSSNDGFISSRPTSRLSKAEEKRQKPVSQLLTRRERERAEGVRR